MAAVVSAYHPDGGSSSTNTTQAAGLFESFLGGSGLNGGLSLAEEMRVQQQQQQILQQHLAAEPVFALAQLRFGKHQYCESNPVRLRPGGAAVFREQFVFTSKRPLQHKRLVLEVGTGRLSYAQHSSTVVLCGAPEWSAKRLAGVV